MMTACKLDIANCSHCIDIMFVVIKATNHSRTARLDDVVQHTQLEADNKGNFGFLHRNT